MAKPPIVGQRRCDGGDVALAVGQRRCGASCGAAKQRRHPWPTMMGFPIALSFAMSMTMSFGFANGSSRSWRLKEAPQSKKGSECLGLNALREVCGWGPELFVLGKKVRWRSGEANRKTNTFGTWGPDASEKSLIPRMLETCGRGFLRDLPELLPHLWQLMQPSWLTDEIPGRDTPRTK